MGYFRKYIRPVLPIICLLIAGISLFYAYTPQGLSYQEIVIDALVGVLILLTASWPLLHFIRRYPTRVGVQLYAILPVVVMAAACWLLNLLIMGWIFPDNQTYKNWLELTMGARLLVSLLFLGWISSIYSMKYKIEQTENALRQRADAEMLLRDAEFFKLRQQLHPHFLYNSLNSINSLILTHPEKAQEMVGKLSEFLRSSVKRDSDEPVNLTEELNHIGNYLDIESIRFGDRLQIVYDTHHDENALVPPFLLQPIVENAIKFGLHKAAETVTITIHTYTTESSHYIKISNPFDPAMQRPPGTGFGLEGVSRRLFLQYGRTDLLEAVKEPNLFTTTLKIPISNV